jgi:hypothetical protein
MEIKIEKNVPIPQIWAGRLPYLKNALEKMDYGDSFFVDKETKRGSARIVAKRLGIAVVTKRVKDGFRVWKIKPPAEEN